MAAVSAPSASQKHFIASRQAPIAAYSSALRAASVYAATVKALGNTDQQQPEISSYLSPDQPVDWLPWETSIELPKEAEIVEALKLSPSDAQGKLDQLLSFLEKKIFRMEPNYSPKASKPTKLLTFGQESGIFSILLCLLALYKISIIEKQKYLEKLNETHDILSDFFRYTEIDPQQELCYCIILYNLIMEQQKLGISYPDRDKLKDRIHQLRIQFNPLPIEIIEDKETKRHRQLHANLDTLSGKNKNPLSDQLDTYIKISEHIGNRPQVSDECLIKARCLLGRAQDENLLNKISDALEYLSSIEKEIRENPEIEYQLYLFERLITVLKEILRISPIEDLEARIKACRHQIINLKRKYTAQIRNKTDSLQQLSNSLKSSTEIADLDQQLESLFNALKETVQWTAETCPLPKREFFTTANSVLNDLKDAYVKLHLRPHPLIEKMREYCDAKLVKILRAQVRPGSQAEQLPKRSDHRLLYIALAIIAGLILFSAAAVWRRRSIIQLKN